MEEPADTEAAEAYEEHEQGAEGWQQGWQEGYYNSDGHFIYYDYGGGGDDMYSYSAGEQQQQDAPGSESEHSAGEDDGSEDAVEEAVRLSYLSWIDEQGTQDRSSLSHCRAGFLGWPTYYKACIRLPAWHASLLWLKRAVMPV